MVFSYSLNFKEIRVLNKNSAIVINSTNRRASATFFLTVRQSVWFFKKNLILDAWCNKGMEHEKGDVYKISNINYTKSERLAKIFSVFRNIRK